MKAFIPRKYGARPTTTKLDSRHIDANSQSWLMRRKRRQKVNRLSAAAPWDTLFRCYLLGYISAPEVSACIIILCNILLLIYLISGTCHWLVMHARFQFPSDSLDHVLYTDSAECPRRLFFAVSPPVQTADDSRHQLAIPGNEGIPWNKDSAKGLR